MLCSSVKWADFLQNRTWWIRPSHWDLKHAVQWLRSLCLYLIHVVANSWLPCSEEHLFLGARVPFGNLQLCPLALPTSKSLPLCAPAPRGPWVTQHHWLMSYHIQTGIALMFGSRLSLTSYGDLLHKMLMDQLVWSTTLSVQSAHGGALQLNNTGASRVRKTTAFLKTCWALTVCSEFGFPRKWVFWLESSGSAFPKTGWGASYSSFLLLHKPFCTDPRNRH